MNNQIIAPETYRHPYAAFLTSCPWVVRDDFDCDQRKRVDRNKPNDLM